MRKIFLISLFALVIFFFKPLYGEQLNSIKRNGVCVLFEEPVKNAAKEVVNIYPRLIAELEKTLKWKLDYEPKVLLIKNRQTFRKMARSDFVVAYAVPQKKFIVIDYSRMNISPFNLGITLKHELCHLLLHCYIPGKRLPRWLDEGVAQWVSDGIAEIIMDRRQSILTRVAFTKNYIPISELAEKFPQNKQSLLLAYEESKNFVEYIIRRFGSDGLLKILGNLKAGDEINPAIEKSISISLYELEKQWHEHLSSNRLTWWLVYLSNNLYGILFFLAAMITIFAFIKLQKKKNDDDDDDDDDYWTNGPGR